MGNDAAQLKHTALLELVVHSDGADAAGDLGHNVSGGVVGSHATVVESHDRDSRVEVAATDRAGQENEDSQGRTDRPRVAGCDDDAEENKRAKELNKDG